MKTLLFLIALVATSSAASILNVRNSTGSTAASPYGFVIHGTGTGWRVTGSWKWSPTVAETPVNEEDLVGMTFQLGSVVLDVTSLEPSEDRFAPTDVDWLVGQAPDGQFYQFAMWIWQPEDGRPSARLDLTKVDVVPEPAVAAMAALGGVAALRRRRNTRA